MAGRGGRAWQWGSRYDSTASASGARDDSVSATASTSRSGAARDTTRRSATQAYLDDLTTAHMSATRAAPSDAERRLWQIDVDTRQRARRRAAVAAALRAHANTHAGALDAHYGGGGADAAYSTDVRDATVLAIVILSALLLLAASAIIVQLAINEPVRDEGAQSAAAATDSATSPDTSALVPDAVDGPTAADNNTAAAAATIDRAAHNTTPSWAYASQLATPSSDARLTPEESASLKQLLNA